MRLAPQPGDEFWLTFKIMSSAITRLGRKPHHTPCFQEIQRASGPACAGTGHTRLISRCARMTTISPTWCLTSYAEGLFCARRHARRRDAAALLDACRAASGNCINTFSILQNCGVPIVPDRDHVSASSRFKPCQRGHWQITEETLKVVQFPSFINQPCIASMKKRISSRFSRLPVTWPSWRYFPGRDFLSNALNQPQCRGALMLERGRSLRRPPAQVPRRPGDCV